MNTNNKEHACACDQCKAMCKKAPCLGTPEDMIRIAKAGFADKLFKTGWLTGMVTGTHDHSVDIIAAEMTPNGCTFLDENGLCTLHDLGLKPTEGKLTNNHKANVYHSVEEIKAKSVTWLVVAEWEKRDFENIKRRVYRKK